MSGALSIAQLSTRPVSWQKLSPTATARDSYYSQSQFTERSMYITVALITYKVIVISNNAM